MPFHPISDDPYLEWFLIAAHSPKCCLGVTDSSGPTAKLGLTISVKEESIRNNSASCIRRVTLARWDQYVVIRTTISIGSKQS